MALINCPECSKEISDKVKSCPHCGYPMEEGNSKVGNSDIVDISTKGTSNTTNTDVLRDKTERLKGRIKRIHVSRKTIIVIALVAIAFAVIATLVLLLTKDIRAYEKANRLLEQQKYERASVMYEELGDYKDSEILYKECLYERAKVLYDAEDYENAASVLKDIQDYEDSKKIYEDCQYQMATDGKFMRDLSTALESRWDMIQNTDEANMNTDESIDHRKKLTDIELNLLQKYRDKQFNDSTLATMANQYIDALESYKKSYDYYNLDYNKYSVLNAKAYSDRVLLIQQFLNDYNLKIDEKYSSDLESILTNAKVVEEEKSIEEQLTAMVSDLNFEVIEDSYGYKTYQATIENTTSVSFSYLQIMVDLISEDNVILGSTYAGQINNFQPGQKAKLEFSTDEEFARMEFTTSYST